VPGSGPGCHGYGGQLWSVRRGVAGGWRLVAVVVASSGGGVVIGDTHLLTRPVTTGAHPCSTAGHHREDGET